MTKITWRGGGKIGQMIKVTNLSGKLPSLVLVVIITLMVTSELNYLRAYKGAKPEILRK